MLSCKTGHKRNVHFLVPAIKLQFVPSAIGREIIPVILYQDYLHCSQNPFSHHLLYLQMKETNQSLCLLKGIQRLAAKHLLVFLGWGPTLGLAHEMENRGMENLQFSHCHCQQWYKGTRAWWRIHPFHLHYKQRNSQKPNNPKPSFLAAFSWPCCSHVDVTGSLLVTQLLSVGLLHLNIWLQNKLPLFFLLASNTEGFLSHPQSCPSVPSRTCIGAKCRKEKSNASVSINLLPRWKQRSELNGYSWYKKRWQPLFYLN